MLIWIAWLIYALIPAIITLAAGLEMQTMAILYFLEVIIAITAWGIWEKTRKKTAEEV